MPKLSDLKVDPALEKDGATVMLPCGMRWTLRRINYPAFLAARDAYLTALEEQYGEGKVPQEEQTAATCRAMGEHLVVDWDASTVLDDDGQPIPFSRDKAVEIMTDPTLHEVHTQVLAACADRENYRLKQLAAEGKGSRRRSAGT